MLDQKLSKRIALILAECILTDCEPYSKAVITGRHVRITLEKLEAYPAHPTSDEQSDEEAKTAPAV